MDIVDGTRIRPAAVTSQDEPAASTSSALPPSQPHPRLTMLLRAPADCKAVLTDAEKASVLVEAKSCLDKMRNKRDVDDKLILDARTGVQPAHVAAALALLCGYYTKRKGVLNPTAAAAAFGHPTSRPAKVLGWLAKLERLEAIGYQEATEALRRKREREEHEEAVAAARRARAAETERFTAELRARAAAESAWYGAEPGARSRARAAEVDWSPELHEAKEQWIKRWMARSASGGLTCGRVSCRETFGSCGCVSLRAV